MPPFDGALDAGNERDASLRRMRCERTHIELPIVQRDRQRLIAELCRAIDQLMRRIRNVVDRIVSGVGVQFDLEHRCRLLKILAVPGPRDWRDSDWTRGTAGSEGQRNSENCLRSARRARGTAQFCCHELVAAKPLHPAVDRRRDHHLVDLRVRRDVSNQACHSLWRADEMPRPIHLHHHPLLRRILVARAPPPDWATAETPGDEGGPNRDQTRTPDTPPPPTSEHR